MSRGKTRKGPFFVRVGDYPKVAVPLEVNTAPDPFLQQGNNQSSLPVSEAFSRGPGVHGERVIRRAVSPFSGFSR